MEGDVSFAERGGVGGSDRVPGLEGVNGFRRGERWTGSAGVFIMHTMGKGAPARTGSEFLVHHFVFPRYTYIAVPKWFPYQRRETFGEHEGVA